MMTENEILNTVDAVRAARYALLATPEALAGIKGHIEATDGETRAVLRKMLADDLRAMRRLGMKVPRRASGG